MKPCIFIHTNEKQIVGALVSKYSFERFASDKNAFDVKLIHTRDHPFLDAHEGRSYLRGGLKREWKNDDLQSFTVLRFMPPELMGYEGRSARRTREIGIRMALGAGQRAVRWMVLSETLTLAGIGVAIGLAGAYALTRLIQARLFGLGRSAA